jgi:hypothetical protein
MPPDPADLVPLAALAVTAALLLPKRRWRTVPRRLRAMARGDRDHLFGPAARGGALVEHPAVRWWQLVRRELPRAIELGLPLHAVALLAELRAADRRRERDAAWQASPSGLLFEHLSCRMTEAELHTALQQSGSPRPASKLRWSPPARLTMPPMSWRIDWERHLESLRQRDDPTAAPTPPPPSPAVVETRKLPRSVEVELEIHSLGVIRLCVDGEDLAPRLLHRPAQAVMWLYLLARDARRPGDRVIRGVFADEMFPGLGADQQRRKVRQRLADLNRDLPKPLLKRVTVDGEYIGLDLTACDFDVRRVLDMATVVRTLEFEDLIAAPCADQVEWALRASAQEFLPGWEEIERRATDGRSGMADIVAAARDQVSAAHLSLLETLADAKLAQQRPGEAVGHLEEALRRRPERGDLARKLVVACERCGLGRRATELCEEYSLEETGR